MFGFTNSHTLRAIFFLRWRFVQMNVSLSLSTVSLYQRLAQLSLGGSDQGPQGSQFEGFGEKRVCQELFGGGPFLHINLE